MSTGDAEAPGNYESLDQTITLRLLLIKLDSIKSHVFQLNFVDGFVII